MMHFKSSFFILRMTPRYSFCAQRKNHSRLRLSGRSARQTTPGAAGRTEAGGLHSKSSSGFTLLETLFSLAIMAMVLAPLYITQGSSLQRIARFSRHIERIIHAQLFLTESVVALDEKTQQSTTEKKIADPATQLKFELKKVGEDSPFKKIKNLYSQQVTLNWQEAGAKKTDSLVLFAYRPEPKKEEAKP